MEIKRLFLGALKKSCVVLCFLTLIYIGTICWIYHKAVQQIILSTVRANNSEGRRNKGNESFLIVYYNPAVFLKNRPDAMSSGFESCQWSNCNITFDRTYANRSDAVIFDGFCMPRNLTFTRPLGQVWIFSVHEPPVHAGACGHWWLKNKTYIFNWTMSYNKNSADIFLPYGEIKKHNKVAQKDFEGTLRKNRTVLMIASNCQGSSKRHLYVKQLKQYVDVDIFGKCGKKWNCGIHYKHDNCFDLIKTYKFYLAFENTFCQQYFTEKFFENFNYDTLMITRGGLHGEARQIFPNGTFLSTEGFAHIKDLGQYLQNISQQEYVHLLKRKSQFYSVGYKFVYQRALCDLCKRLNFQETYRNTIKDMEKWVYQLNPCVKRENVNDIV